MEADEESKPPTKETLGSLGESVYRGLLKTQKPSDGIFLLMSPAIRLSEVLAEYLMNMGERELYLFVGLEDL